MSQVLFCISKRGDPRRRREIKQNSYSGNNTNNQKGHEENTIIQPVIHSSGEARNCCKLF